LPVLTVRGISDKADGLKYVSDEQGWQPAAAAHAAAFACALAAEILGAAAEEAGSGSGNTEARPAPLGGRQDVVAHGGGVAYGVLGGDMYVNKPAAPSGRPAARPSGAATAGAAAHDSRLTWRQLAEPVGVTWRSDLTGSAGGYERPALELHLVAVGGERLEVRRLRPFADDLASLGRTRGLFTVAERLSIDSFGRAAWATSVEAGRGPAGLAVLRTGQRSAWTPLPHDGLGAVLDPDDLVKQIDRLLELLAAVDLPAPARIAAAVGVEPVALLSEGQVSAMPRSQAEIGYRQAPHLRIPAEDALSYEDLVGHPVDVADELASRLLADFRQRMR
jgi:hypothetical protein